MTISWTQYWTIILALTVAYYILIGLVLYKKEVARLLRPAPLPSFPSHTSEDNLYTQAGALSISLQNIIADGMVHHSPAAEVLAAVKTQLRKYPALRHTDFERGITEELAEQLATRYAVPATALKGLWD